MIWLRTRCDDVFWKDGERSAFRPLLHDTPRSVNPKYRGGKEQGVDAVEHASVAGEDCAGVFYLGAALDKRFDQIAKLSGDVEDYCEENDRADGHFFEGEKPVAP